MRALLKTLSAAALLIAPAVVAGPANQSGSAFEFVFDAIDGRPMPLQQFRGKVLLVVNTDRKSTRLNSSHRNTSRMPSSA